MITQKMGNWPRVLDMRRDIRSMSETRLIEDYLIELVKFKTIPAVRDEIDFWLHEPGPWNGNAACPKWDTRRWGWKCPRPDRSKRAASKGGRQIYQSVGSWSNRCYRVISGFIPLGAFTPTGKPLFFHETFGLIGKQDVEYLKDKAPRRWGINVKYETLNIPTPRT